MPFPLTKAVVFSSLDDETIIELVSTEDEYMVSSGYADWGRELRFRAIGIIKSRMERDSLFAVNGQNTYIPFLALNYFDRFASLHTPDISEGLNEDFLGHIIDCCLKLAVKYQNPYLLQDENVVENTSRMEQLICTELKYRMNPITPLTYLEYLVINKLNQWHSKGKGSVDADEVIRRARNCIMIVFYNIKVLRERPSVVAIRSVIEQIDNHWEFDNLKRRLMQGLEDLEVPVNECDEEIRFV